MQTYHEGERFPGRIGRTYQDSEAAFPMPPTAPDGAPNVLYIIIDDIGFGWSEPFGGLIRTPNIAKLAANGLRYTNFTTTALCSPTRSCLVTGRNHHSVGMADIPELASGFPGYNAPSTHVTQYFEMLGNRGLSYDGWKVVTYHGRKPWENAAAWGFEDDHWELYDLANDPAEAHDLMADRDTANLDDPMVKKCLELVTMWWAEAGQYQVLPLDDRFQARALDREALYSTRARTTWYDGAVRVQPFEAPPTLNRSWSILATIEVPDGGATGPIAAIGGDSSGWSLYLNDGVPTFCYNFPGPEYTYIRGTDALPSGRHEVGYSFEKTGEEPLGAGGIGRVTVDGNHVAEGQIARTATVGYSMDETFDIGWDKGSPVSEDYGPIARFTGRIVKVEFDTKPDLHPAHDEHHADAKLTQAMIRQ